MKTAIAAREILDLFRRDKMPKQKMKIFIRFFFFFIAAFVVVSCTSFTQTKPNKFYKGPYPETFKTIQEASPMLTMELMKLPEFQDGISYKEKAGLEKICLLYAQDPTDFDKAFHEMHKIGYPEIRKYCTPLQAIFWLALDDQLNQIDISKYDLITLLNQAWYKPGFENDGTERWNDFGAVTERLNSPELIDFYESRNLSYQKIRLRSIDEYKSPRIIFKGKRGECWLYTAFSVYCLRKAGYEARAITVFHGKTRNPNHVTCMYVNKDGEEYILDNTLRAYIHSTGIYKKKVYLNIYPYYVARRVGFTSLPQPIN